jgi:hypothetical protein
LTSFPDEKAMMEADIKSAGLEGRTLINPNLAEAIMAKVEVGLSAQRI